MTKKAKNQNSKRGQSSGRLNASKLPIRSQKARERALHVLSAMRRDSSLSLARAAKLQDIKTATVFRYFPSALKKSNGKFQATKGDRYSVTLYVPDAQGNPVAVNTRSSKQRREISEYLRDVGRYQRGNREALARWKGRKIAGVELITDAQTISEIEPALSDFSLYRTFTGGSA